MPDIFNGFIISSQRTFERNASSEVYYLLTEILKLPKNIEIFPIKELSGLSIVHLHNDANPNEILKEIRTKLEDEPSILQFVLKIVPIQYRTRSTLEEMKECVKILSQEITENTTWKIQLRRRHTQLNRDDIITTLAKEIKKGKVELTSPEKVIIVEVIGKWTYLGITDISELQVTKYQLQEMDEFTF